MPTNAAIRLTLLRIAGLVSPGKSTLDSAFQDHVDGKDKNDGREPLLGTYIAEHAELGGLLNGGLRAEYYSPNQWAALNVYVTDGRLAIDNNAAERAVKPYAIGRRNWLFFGSDDGGRRLATVSIFTATCQQCGVNLWTWLKDTLTRLPMIPADQLATILPVPPVKSRAAETLEYRHLSGAKRTRPKSRRAERSRLACSGSAFVIRSRECGLSFAGSRGSLIVGLNPFHL